MANTIFPIVKPICDFWNYITHDQTMPQLEELKGGVGAGSGWHTKFLRSERDRVNKEYVAVTSRFWEEPKALDVVWDNILRLTVFSGFERVFALR